MAASTQTTNRTQAVAENPSGGLEDFNLSGGLKPVDTSERPGFKAHDVVVSADGRIYEGETLGGIPNGRGTMTDIHGTRQEGQWINGRPYRVSGVWVGPDGTREEGTWHMDGTACGGTIKWTDGRVYKGDWRIVEGSSELPDGSGTMTWPDGRKYVGDFRNGRMDGRGVMRHPDGKIEDGVWKQGRFVGPTK